VIRINGKQRWKTFSTKKAAEAHLDKNSTDVRNGTYREIIPGTFEGYAQKWREKYLTLAEMKPATLSGYSYVLDKHLIPAFGDFQMAEISTANITDFRASLQKGGADFKAQSPKSIANLLNLLSRFFADAIEDGYVKVSPMPTRRKADKKKKEGKGRALLPEHAQLLLAECDDSLRLVVLLGLLAGLRRGEIFGLEWSAIAWDQNLIRVRKNLYFRHGKHHEIPEGETAAMLAIPKTEKSCRDVDLSPELKKELRTRYLKSTDKHGLIFQTGNETPMDPHNVYERWFIPAVERARKKAEERKDKSAEAALTGLRLHDLRHTFGSWKVEQGEDILYVSAQLGHVKPSITFDVYSHLLKKHRPSAAEQTDARLFATAKEQRPS
jgi:integrase